jgi:hypothetical protein
MMKGRPPVTGESRSHFLRVRLAPQELERLDRARGEVSRSDYVRGLLENGAPKGKKA